MSTDEQAASRRRSRSRRRTQEGSLLEQVIVRDQADRAIAGRRPDPHPDRRSPAKAPSPGTATSPRRSTRPSRPSTGDVQAAGRHHAQPRFPETGRDLARPAPPGHEQRDQRQAENQGLQRPQARAVQGCGQGGRVRPEPDVQEALRERVRHARRRALRGPDRRLRVHQPSRGHRAAGQDVQRGRGRVLPVHLGGRPQLFGFDGWDELSKPRDLEKIFEPSSTPSGAVPRLGRLALRHAGHAARAVARSLRHRKPSRSRSSTTRRRAGQPGASQAGRRTIITAG